MRRSTIYLPDELKRALERAAEREGISEATFIRRTLEHAVQAARPPKPRLPLFSSGDRSLAERVDGALAPFGES